MDDSYKESERAMEERKWDELNIDCLVEIFARVGTESLSRYIPFVCKSWYHASLVPKCWETLVFPPLNYFFGHILGFSYYYSDELVKSVVDRSQGIATHIVFQGVHLNRSLVYISEKCPELKILHLWHFSSYVDDIECALTSDLIYRWKKLEFLHISCVRNRSLIPILKSISIHCKNFVGLNCSSSYIHEAASAAIAKFIPKIKYLNMNSSELSRKNLVTILKGCKELESLDVSFCVGFDACDTEILELASHIQLFNCEASTICRCKFLGCFGCM